MDHRNAFECRKDAFQSQDATVLSLGLAESCKLDNNTAQLSLICSSIASFVASRFLHRSTATAMWQPMWLLVSCRSMMTEDVFVTTAGANDLTVKQVVTFVFEPTERKDTVGHRPSPQADAHHPQQHWVLSTSRAEGSSVVNCDLNDSTVWALLAKGCFISKR